MWPRPSLVCSDLPLTVDWKASVRGVVRIWLGERFCVDAIVAIAQYSPELGGCAPSLDSQARHVGAYLPCQGGVHRKPFNQEICLGHRMEGHR